jgi:hypothetical protein
MIVNLHELGGVYLRLVEKRADGSHAASFLAKTIADLAIIDAR